VTLNVRPATVNDDMREAVVGFAATEKFTVPLPDPDPPDVTVIQGALLTAPHEQPEPVVTFTLPAPPPEPNDALIGERPNTQVGVDAA
jgi:hypothetical protein